MLKPDNIIFTTVFGYEKYYRVSDDRWYDSCYREVIYRRIWYLLEGRYQESLEKGADSNYEAKNY